jgi:Protein of unknown function (DUF642)
VLGLTATLTAETANAIEQSVATSLTPTVAEVFTNGSFENDYMGWTESGNQNITTTTVSDGVKAVQFNGGNAVPNGVLSQTFATTPGLTYALSFDAGVSAYQSTAQMSMHVSVQGNTTLLTQTVTVSGRGTGFWYTPQSFNFVADGTSATLTFQDTSAVTTNIDLLLDNVKVGTTQAPPPIATPGPTVPPLPTATPGSTAPPPPTTTTIGIQGEKFLINGSRTFAGGQLDGTLPNSRMVNATFDDANPATVGNWKYPDGIAYNPTRQTAEFVAAVPRYRARGLLGVTLNFQGGNPIAGAQTQPWDNTAFNADGSLKPAYLTRMDQAIKALDSQGMVAILGYFYFGQDARLTDETAVKNAVTNATQWVLDQGYTNVMIEIDNEADAGYHHTILQPARVAELITAVQTQSANRGKRLLVSVSLTGGQVPSTTLAQTCDFILLHGNAQTAATLTTMINTVRAYGLNKPIIFNEDSTSTPNFQAATAGQASWGYHDGGKNNYVDGFQSPPTNWGINTVEKDNFFDLLTSLASTTPAPVP